MCWKSNLDHFIRFFFYLYLYLCVFYTVLAVIKLLDRHLKLLNFFYEKPGGALEYASRLFVIHSAVKYTFIPYFFTNEIQLQ